jgi:phosphoribosylformylglycinamidine cyclo-ligase
VIRAGSWEVLPIFKLLQDDGGVSSEEMHRVFNMGIGMVLMVSAGDVATVQRAAGKLGVKSYVIGAIRRGARGTAIE